MQQNTSRIIPSIHDNSGQAATEFIIAAVYVLVPLFLLVPLIGKYIDIKHAAVSQARFESWEYTAWFGPDEDIMQGTKSRQRAARRPWSETREAGSRLFFADPADKDYGTSMQRRGTNPLWNDHHGTSLFVRASELKMRGRISEQDTPDPTSSHEKKGILDWLLNVIGDATRIFGDLLNIFGVKAKFDTIYTRGYFVSQLKVPVRSPDEVLPWFDLAGNDNQTSFRQPLTIQARAAVLSSYWNAGSTDVATSESKGLVLTSVLQPISDGINDVLDPLERALNHRKIGPLEIIFEMPHPPQFGYVQDDLIPYEHLQDEPYRLEHYTVEKTPTLWYYEKKEHKDK